MNPADKTITPEQIARVVRSDSLYLFLGTALVTIALLAAGAVAVRRKRDLLLAYFALFAGLYGARLIVQRSLVEVLFLGSEAFHRTREAMNYLVPIPALLFFQAAGFGRFLTRFAVWGFATLGTILFASTLIFGSHQAFIIANNVAVLALLGILFIELARPSPASQTQEFRIARFGLAVFAAFAVYDNVVGLFARGWPRLEALGFAVFLGTLGYVTARRMFQREARLIAIEKELDIARRIQFSILPEKFPARAAFSVAARYLPMTSVAGDFYDFVVAEEEHTGILIADVSGHGVPAALIASMVKLAAASQKNNASDPAAFLSGMNAALVGNTQTQFVTAGYIFLDAISRRMSYAAAGHPPMLLVRAGRVSEVEENGLMLAAFDFATYSNRSFDLRPTDRFLLYTDGVIEASNPAGESFGSERLRQSVLRTSTLAAEDAADAIVQEIKTWAAVQEDDITVVLCDFVAR